MTAYTTFPRELFAIFRARDRAGPVQMLNLIRLRQHALYESGESGSGREAYAAYGRLSAPVFAALGGRILWRGRWELGLIAPARERWDICFIAEYPSVAAFAELFRNATYREAMRHRLAAVADSRLVRLAAMQPGVAFHDGEAG